MNIKKYVCVMFMGVFFIGLSGCSSKTSVEYFKKHPEAADSMAKHCAKLGAQAINDEACKNAGIVIEQEFLNSGSSKWPGYKSDPRFGPGGM